MLSFSAVLAPAECLSLTSSLLHPHMPLTTRVPGWDSRGSLPRVAAFPSD